jgi:hypothetical protein
MSKAAGQGWFSGQIPADAQRNLIKGTMTEVVVSVKTNNSDSTKLSLLGSCKAALEVQRSAIAHSGMKLGRQRRWVFIFLINNPPRYFFYPCQICSQPSEFATANLYFQQFFAQA